MKKFDEIWKEANEEADLKYDPKGALARSLFLYSALKERIEPFLEKQQPEIPEVPPFVADWYEKNKGALEYSIWDYIRDWEEQEEDDFYNFMDNNQLNPIETILAMKNGYTVAKEKRFYLKNKLTGLYLYESKKGFFEQDKLALELTSRCDYTQQEIDSMETGSYEQIEVKE